MALLPNSSLQSWIYFNETAWNNVSFPPCQYLNWTWPNADEPTYNLELPIIMNTSCTQVCNDSKSLFTNQSNLATCGLWSTLVYAYNFDDSAPDPTNLIETAPEDLLDAFAEVGLDARDPEYFQRIGSYADVMSDCFVYLYQNVKAWKSSDSSLVSGACTKNGLFPYSSSSRSTRGADEKLNRSATAIYDCLTDLCSPVALNPEFAGIGFIFSFVYQSVIAVMAVEVLLLQRLLHLERLPRSKEAFVAGLVSFHEAQCYFSSTVQVAALILVRQILKNTGAAFNSYGFSETHSKLLDTSALIVLATSGFIPVTFGLTSITLVARQSWHLTMLSLITFALATATLSTIYHYDRQYGEWDDYYNSLQNDEFIDFGACYIDGNIGGTLFPLCGSSLLNSNAISSSIITRWWVWVAWANCMAWMLLCFFCKLMDGRLPKMVRSRLDSALTCHAWIKLLGTFVGELHWGLLIYFVASIPSFVVQFYLINDFGSRDFISRDWTFGQIIAVTVWAPSICESFIPAFFELGREVFDSRKFEDWLNGVTGRLKAKRSKNTASSGSDPEAVPLQSLSSAVDSHGTGQEDQQSEIVIEDSVEPA